MALKGRLKFLHCYIGPDERKIYDLFCDHGLLGSELLKSNKASVAFNDKRDHLISNLRLEHGENRMAEFHLCDAQNLHFYEKSLVVMAGVGGLTMIDCFEHWIESHESTLFKSLEFVVSPHYYTFELRKFLLENGFSYSDQKLVKDKSQIYEVSRIKFLAKNANQQLFDKEVWQSFGEVGRELLSYSQKNLANKSVMSDWEKELLMKIKEFMSLT